MKHVLDTIPFVMVTIIHYTCRIKHLNISPVRSCIITVTMVHVVNNVYTHYSYIDTSASIAEMEYETDSWPR